MTKEPVILRDPMTGELFGAVMDPERPDEILGANRITPDPFAKLRQVLIPGALKHIADKMAEKTKNG